jgi:phage shock protein PspC (stress-responsive transcriptional regulator)
MSSPYPPPPKKLLRNRNTKMVGGVCAGVADYLNMDVTLVRILTVILSLFTGVPIVLYIVALFVVPEGDGPAAPPTYPGVTPSTDYGYRADSSMPAPSPGPAPQPPAADPVWGSTGAPWEQPPSTPGDPERKPDA